MEAVKGLNWLDWVLLTALAGGLVYGWVRGFVAMLTGLAAYVLSLIIAGRYTSPVVAWLNGSWGATDWLAGVLSRRIALPSETDSVPASTISWDKVLQWLAALPLPEEYKTQLAHKVQEWSQAGANTSVADFIFQQLAAGILSAAVFLILAGVLGYALSYVGKLVSTYVSEVPLVGTLNRTLGSAAGLLEVAMSASILLSLLAPLYTLSLFSGLGDAAGASRIAQWLISLYGLISKWLFGQGGSFFFYKG